METRFRIGAWVVEPAAYRLHGPEGEVAIEPKAMAVLCCLAEHAGEVVSRDRLLATVWPDTCVVEEALTRCVSALRKVFRDDPRNPTVIETIRKGGYRLLLPVTPLAASPPRAAPPARSRAQSRRAVPVAAAVLLVLLIGFAGLARFERAESPVEPLNAVPVTSTAGMEFDARLSPDGAHVVFAWGGPEGDNIDLYVKLLGQAAPERLTTSAASDHSPAWSPDGNRIAFMRRQNGGCELVVIPSIGGAEESVGTCEANYFGDLAWSPNGQWLAFSEEDAGGVHRLVLFSLATREKRVLTNPEGAAYGDHAPAFSPDGAHIAFVRMQREEHHDLFVVSADGSGAARRLTFDENVLRGHTWMPSGESLVVASTRTGSVELWRVPFTEGNAAPVWLPVGAAGASAPSMVPGSDRLLFAQDRSDTNLWSVDLAAGGATQPFASSTHHERAPHLSPDGEHVAFVSYRSGSPEVWTARWDGSDLQRRTFFDGPFVDAPRWSPDGTRIAFDARPDGHVDLHVLDLESGLIRRLTNAPTDEAVPRWSRDGATIYFASNREGRREVWQVPALGGTPRRVTTQGGIVLEEGTDGRSAYVARNDTSGLWRVAPEHPPTRLTEHLHEVDWGNWVVTERGVFFVRREEKRAILVRLDDRTGSTETVATLSPPGRSAWSIPWSQPGITLTPDGSRLIFARTDRQESDLWATELPGVHPSSALYTTRQTTL